MSKLNTILKIKSKYLANKENLYSYLLANRVYLPHSVNELVNLPPELFFTLQVFEKLHNLLPTVIVLKDEYTYLFNYQELAKIIQNKQLIKQNKLDRIENEKMTINFESQLEVDLLSHKQNNGDHPLAGDLYKFLYNAGSLTLTDINEIEEHLDFCKKCKTNIEKLKYLYGQ